MKKIFLLFPFLLCAQNENANCYGNPSCMLNEKVLGAEFIADFLYMQPLVDGLSYAIRNDVRQQSMGGVDGTPGGPILDLKPDWEPAFRVAVCYVPDVTARLVWMHFFGKTTTEAHADISQPGLGLEGIWVPPVNSSRLYSSAKLHWKLDFDTLDLDLGKCYQVSPFLKMNPSCSVRFARINQSFHAVYQQDWAQAENNFFGIGPRIGLDSQWCFVQDWSLFGGMAASMLYGQFETHSEFFSQAAVLQNISDDFFRLEPNVEFSLGIGWQRFLSNRHCRLGFRLSYEAQVFWNQIALRQPMGSDAPQLALSQTRDLALQGFALRGSLVF